MAFSSQVRVMIGPHLFPFISLHAAVEGVAWLCWPNPLRAFEVSNIMIVGVLQRRIRSSTLRIDNVLDALRGLKVFDSRSIMRPASAISSYWEEENPFPQDDSTIYSFKYAAEAVNKDPILYPLALSRSGMSGDEMPGLGMPGASWVPDWDAPSPVYHLNSIGSDFKASTALLTTTKYKDSSGQSRKQYVMIKGQIVDTISGVADYLPPRRELDRYHIGSLNSIRFSEWYDWARKKAQPTVDTKRNPDRQVLLVITTCSANDSNKFIESYWPLSRPSRPKGAIYGLIAALSKMQKYFAWRETG